MIGSDAALGAGLGAAGKYAESVATQIVSKQGGGEISRLATRGDSFIKQGKKTGDAAKVRKGEELKRQAEAIAAQQAKNNTIVYWEESADEVATGLREDEKGRRKR